MLYPINDIVLVEPITQSKSDGGIVLPGSVQDSEILKRGKVHATGNGTLLENGEFSGMQVEPGHTVAYLNRPKSQFPSLDGYLVMQERDILAIITDKNDNC